MSINNRFSIKSIMLVSIAAIAFITYNTVLFVISGFSGHFGAFWVSYIFMLLAFAALAISGFMLKTKEFQPKDWLLGLPILTHCIMFIALQTACSIIFMLLDHVCPWGVAFVVQLLLLAVHLVFVISCFIAKETIEEIQTNTSNKTTRMNLLRANADIAAKAATDEQTKKAFTALAEKIRYSDPMSNEILSNIENELNSIVCRAKEALSANDTEQALLLCEKASLLLEERNQKCMVFKKH